MVVHARAREADVSLDSNIEKNRPIAVWEEIHKVCSFIVYSLTCSLCVDKHIYVHIIFIIIYIFLYYSFSIRFRLRRKALCSVSGVSLSEVCCGAEQSVSPAGV